MYSAKSTNCPWSFLKKAKRKGEKMEKIRGINLDIIILKLKELKV